MIEYRTDNWRSRNNRCGVPLKVLQIHAVSPGRLGLVWVVDSDRLNHLLIAQRHTRGGRIPLRNRDSTRLHQHRRRQVTFTIPTASTALDLP